jgi:Fur family iron response transcriptional regulator
MRLRQQESLSAVPHAKQGAGAVIAQPGAPAANGIPSQQTRSKGVIPPPVLIKQEQLPLSRSEIIELLHRFDVMPTSQRVQIAEVIYSRPQHLSAEQVLEKVSAMGHSISRATIYNTLGLFSEKGLVRQVIIDPDRVLYDPHTAHHHHFYNCDSGELIDIDDSAVEFQTIPNLPAGTSLANIDVVFELRQTKPDNGS